MKCQHCGAVAPTRQVVFRQNIGLFLTRFPTRTEGAFCKPCIHRLFWRMTLINLVAGWWGIISFFANIIFILGNISTYIQCLGMPVSKGTPRCADDHVILAPPVDFSAERIVQYKDEIVRLLDAGEPVATVCEIIARRASAPESDVQDYIDQHLQNAKATL